jgi:uncharacterized protein
MPEVVFWDTAAFVALANRDDALHDAAIQVSEKLARAGARVLTTDAVLTEVANTFSRIAFRSLARQVIEAYQASVRMRTAQLVRADAQLWQQGWRLFVERSDKDWSLTDCISFVVMQDRGIIRAFTADHHFAQAGFEKLL